MQPTPVLILDIIYFCVMNYGKWRRGESNAPEAHKPLGALHRNQLPATSPKVPSGKCMT